MYLDNLEKKKKKILNYQKYFNSVIPEMEINKKSIPVVFFLSIINVIYWNQKMVSYKTYTKYFEKCFYFNNLENLKYHQHTFF